MCIRDRLHTRSYEKDDKKIYITEVYVDDCHLQKKSIGLSLIHISKIRQSKQVSEEEKAYKELLKQINKCIKKFEKLDSYVLATLSEDELNTFQSKCFELSMYLQEHMSNEE